MKKRIITASLLAGGMLLLGSAAMAGQPKVLICHAPPGNPSNAHTISVGPKAVPAHLAHGDIACTCEEIDACETQGGNLNEVTCGCTFPELSRNCSCTGGSGGSTCFNLDSCDISQALAAECETFCVQTAGNAGYILGECASSACQ